MIESDRSVIEFHGRIFRLYGCYENLVGGQLADALEDISGGVAERINVKKQLINDSTDSSRKLFHKIKEAFDQQALIVAAIAVRSMYDDDCTANTAILS